MVWRQLTANNHPPTKEKPRASPTTSGLPAFSHLSSDRGWMVRVGSRAAAAEAAFPLRVFATGGRFRPYPRAVLLTLVDSHDGCDPGPIVRRDYHRNPQTRQRRIDRHQPCFWA